MITKNQVYLYMVSCNGGTTYVTGKCNTLKNAIRAMRSIIVGNTFPGNKAYGEVKAYRSQDDYEVVCAASYLRGYNGRGKWQIEEF